MKTLVRLTVVIAGLWSVAAMADDIIIESRREGQNYDKYKETAGKWADSNNPANTAKSGAAGLTPQGQCGSRKYVLNSGGGEAGSVQASARFSPKLSKAGHYYVYATFPKAGNANPVNYVIKHAKGQETKSVPQDGWGGLGSPNAGVWLSLGDYDFSTGDDQYVELQVPGDAAPPDPRTGGQAFADAVRFSTSAVTDAMAGGASAAAKPPVASSGTSSAPPTIGSSNTNSSSSDSSAGSTADLTWLSDIKSAQTEASKSNKKILVFFFSPESERSNAYDKKVFTNPKVKAALNKGFVMVRINIDENRPLANNLQVFRAGTINLYDAKGNGIQQLTETMDADELVAKLKGL